MIQIKTIPQKKENLEISNRIKAICIDRNENITKRLKIASIDFTVNIFDDATRLISGLGIQGEKLGIFSGYVDYSNEINIVSPENLEPIFSDNLNKQLIIMIDDCLYKMYLCKNFFKETKDYKLYYKYLTNSISSAISGNYNQDTIAFELKNYNPEKKYKKDTEILMILYVLIDQGASEMILDNLSLFYQDCDVKTTIFKLFKKEYKEIIHFYNKEHLKNEKEIRKIR